MIHLIRAPSSDFPSDALKWKKENAAPKMALKLMKCCKYFQHFPKFPFFVVKEVKLCNGRCYCSNYKKGIQKFENIENISTKKLWITEELSIYGISNLTSLLIPKIAVCDIKKLTLDKQNLSFDEFKFLTDSGHVEHLELYNTNINFENGDPVFVDYILKCIPNIQQFHYFNHESSFLSPEFENIFENINVSKLNFMLLNMISYSTFESFSKFMQKNPQIEYDIGFHDTVLCVEETQKLLNFVQEILDAGVTEFPPPFISFHGQSEKQFDALYSLSQQYDIENEDGKR